VPDLDAILDLELPGFVVARRDDQGASVTKFREDQDGIESERVWLLALKAADESARPDRFVFGKPKVEGIKAVYQRYDDADLATVKPEIALGYMLDTGNPTWSWVLLGFAFVVYLFWFFLSKPAAGAGVQAGNALVLPQHVTPFTVLSLLQQVAARGRFDEATRTALAADMARIEACHFGRAQDPSLDLGALARSWLSRAS
jgi:hypothetical protein